jgi:hypothetical protein
VNKVDLRPLSLGEVLDRTFSLYRQNVLLFVALAGIPKIPALVATLANLQLGDLTATSISFTSVGMTFLTYVLIFIGYLFSQGGTVLAVSELYLGRVTTVTESFRRATNGIGSLVGVLILSGLAIGGGFLFLIAPGVFLMCRLFVCVPAVVIERKGPSAAFSRSWELTDGFAGRAFVILCLYFAVAIGFGALIQLPLTLAMVANARDPVMLRTWASLQAVFSSFLEVLLTPILLIATSIYYYDLRVRKEAFDLQVMMDTGSEP